jgi:Fe-S cluster assembly scaffold protein SufB
MSELEKLLEAFGFAGGDRSILENRDVAHMVAVGHKILSARDVEGLEVEARETHDGIAAKVRVREGVKIGQPVHMCFGVVHKRGSQRIRMDVRMEKNSSARFIAHCLFPNAEQVRHIMEASVDVGENAEMHYTESHFHGPYGGIEVVPKARIMIGESGRYFSDFTLTTGRVGRLDIDYTVEAGKNSVAELTARVFGHGNDRINIRESISLSGENARGLIKTRIALEHEAAAEVTGITKGKAPGARGHVDCMEIIKDQAVASAIPIVSVTDPLAKVTHEAAIGSVDKRQMETLMSHGLTPEQAVDVIVKGILS